MDENEHNDLMNYLESLEALDEADKELEETLGYFINPTTQEINMEINIHRVSKIEVKKRVDLKSFSARDIVIHSKEYDYNLGDFIDRQISLNCFFEDKSIGKLVYTDQNLSVGIASKLPKLY